MEILALQQKLERLNLPVSWEPAEKLHLTLNFLGSLPAENINVLRTRIAPVIRSYPVFKLTPFFLETLYNRHDSSLVYLAPTGDVEILKNLQKDLRAVLNDLRLPQANRFLPHITIGKFKKADPVMIKQFLGQIAEFPFASLSSFEVNKVTLYESFLTRQGSSYQVVDRVMIK